MKDKKLKTVRSSKYDAIQQEPHRVAPRLEGVIKNRGIKPKKKKPKQKM